MERCVYQPSTENSEWTECQRQAWVSSNLYGFTYALQTFGVERFKKNVGKSFKGFNFALNRLFPVAEATSASSTATLHSPLGAHGGGATLRNTAQAAASKLAASVIATN